MSETILVCGFMGSGKSTFTHKLGNSNEQWKSYDLDEEICHSLNILPSKLGDWIRTKGIPAFRQKEIEVLTKLIARAPFQIIALGGGTLEAPGFWELKNKTGAALVYLKTDLKTCLERTVGDSNRPLRSMSDDGLKILHTEREINYLKADLILSEEKIKEIDDILSLVHNLRGQKPTRE